MTPDQSTPPPAKISATVIPYLIIDDVRKTIRKMSLIPSYGVSTTRLLGGLADNLDKAAFQMQVEDEWGNPPPAVTANEMPKKWTWRELKTMAGDDGFSAIEDLCNNLENDLALQRRLFEKRDKELQEVLAEAVDIERERNALRAQNTELVADRERLDWLESAGLQIIDRNGRNFDEDFAALRQTIDAARKSTP